MFKLNLISILRWNSLNLFRLKCESCSLFNTIFNAPTHSEFRPQRKYSINQLAFGYLFTEYTVERKGDLGRLLQANEEQHRLLTAKCLLRFMQILFRML